MAHHLQLQHHHHHHHQLLHHYSSHELISPPSSVSSSAMASTTTLPQQQLAHSLQLHQQSSNPHLNRQDSASSLHQQHPQMPMPIGSPPEPLQYSQNSRPLHRRLSSGQQNSLSGLSALQNGDANMNGLQINGSNAQNQQLGGGPPPHFDPGRSPPSKNLAHVPCKFFRQNQCQAGRSCPFSHAMDQTTDAAPCKYFQKGNCKFGAKCANAHILPDGRRINRPSFNNGPLQLGGRIVPEYQNHRASALHNSLLSAGVLPQHPFAGAQGFGGFDGSVEHPGAYDMGYVNGVTYETHFGSPREENGPLGLSPLGTSHRTLGPLDVGLPGSLDSNEVSWYAKYGRLGESVPSKFGMESPPASLPQTSALRSLHQSAFADGELSELSRSRRSPTLIPEETSFSQRLQARLGRSKYQISSSMPRTVAHITTDDSPFDNSEVEDLVPTNILQDVYGGDRGKEIKNRRMSKPEHEDPIIGSWHRRGTAPNTPGEPTSSVGSPIAGGRFGPLITARRRDEDSPISGPGHVGSPLRHTIHGGRNNSPPYGAIGHHPEAGSYVASPGQRALSNLRPPGSLLTSSLKSAQTSPSGELSNPIGQRLSSSGSPRGGKSIPPIDEDPQLFAFDDESVESTAKKPTAINGKPNGLGLELQSHNENLLLSDMNNLYLGSR